MYTSKCVIQNCYIKLLFKYLKVQGLTNVCVFDLFTLWLHFKFGCTLIETWYTHVHGVFRLQLHGTCRSAYLHIKLFLIDLHSNILQQFTYKPCIFVHYFKITWLLFFLKFPCFLCVGLNLRHNAYTCRYSLCRRKCRQEHEAFIDTTTSSPFEFWVVYSRTEHVYCIEC